ncbi:MAG: type II secretion system F family protein [Phycisphaerae bacterium]
MPDYQYIARSATGQQVTGVMQAENEAAVARTLDEKQLFPVRVNEKAESAFAPRRSRIKARDVGVLYGQIADLLRAGVPLLRTLKTLQRAAPKEDMKQVLHDVTEEVSAGTTLADAMEQHPDVFLKLHTAMIRAGESAGFLEDSLMDLSEFIERQDELRGKVRGAMIYPVVLVVVGTIIITGLLVFVVPVFREMLGDVDLPLPSRLLFGLSEAVNEHLALTLTILVAGVLSVYYLIRSEGGRKTWESIKLKIPVLGKTIKSVAITRFCRIFGTMLHNGVPILKALEISRRATGSLHLSEAIAKAAEAVRAGEALAEPLNESEMFPPEIIEMISVGEESNQLEVVLRRIADTVETRTNQAVDQAVRLVEPLILVVLAFVICFIAIGLLYPVFTLVQSLQ